jgi:hypothetical protein
MNKDGPILLADDDEYDVEFLQRAFTEAHIHNTLYAAQDGQVAIDYLSGTGQFADRVQFPLPRLVLLESHGSRRGLPKRRECLRDKADRNSRKDGLGKNDKGVLANFC